MRGGLCRRVTSQLLADPRGAGLGPVGRRYRRRSLRRSHRPRTGGGLARGPAPGSRSGAPAASRPAGQARLRRAAADRRPSGAATTGSRSPASTRFDALVSSTAVAQSRSSSWTEKQVAARKRSSLLERPFAARIKLADPPRVQTIRAVAFDARSAASWADDSLVVNRIDVTACGCASASSRGDPTAGLIEISAEVTVPLGARARTHRALSQRHPARALRHASPIRYRVPTPEGAGPEDYVRVAAYPRRRILDRRRRLARRRARVEEVEVNLVELHVVASDSRR